MMYWRCKCGNREAWESGMPPAACDVCEKCGSTLARSPDAHREPQPHEFEARYSVKSGALDCRVCVKCGTREPSPAAPHPEAQALDSQLQQPDGHSTRASGVCASTAPPTAQPRGTDAQILKERELTASAIRGAMAFGYLNTNPPPNEDHWLAEFWREGRQRGLLEEKAAVPERICYYCNHPAKSPCYSDGEAAACNAPSRKSAAGAQQQDDHAGSPAPSPVAVRYRDASGRWRYLNFPFTKGWAFPMSLGTPEPLYAKPTPSAQSSKAALSDEEILSLGVKHGLLVNIGDGLYGPLPCKVTPLRTFARAIEAAHGITKEQA